jgi:thymidylate kinase
MRRVEEGFEEIARSEPRRVRTLDALLSPERLAENVGREILKLRGVDGDF